MTQYAFLSTPWAFARVFPNLLTWDTSHAGIGAYVIPDWSAMG